jgi:transposase
VLAWLTATLARVSAKSGLANAIRYSLVRWDALTRYADDGRIEIDNNSAERSIRPLMLGRRNYLFAGSDRGGDSAATYTAAWAHHRHPPPCSPPRPPA